MKKTSLTLPILCLTLSAFLGGCTGSAQLGVDAPVEKFSGKDLPASERSCGHEEKCAKCSAHKNCGKKCSVCAAEHLTKKEADDQGIKCDTDSCTDH